MNDYRAKVVKNNVPHPCFLQNFKRLYKPKSVIRKSFLSFSNDRH